MYNGINASSLKSVIFESGHERITPSHYITKTMCEKLKNLILLFAVALLSSNSFSQIKHTDLRNENGGPYEYQKGPAYYNDSLYTGGVETYYSDTVLWSKTSYVNGEPNGYEIFYFETGSPWCIGLRENRAKQGKWVFFRRNGEIQGVEVFKDGYLISEPVEIEEQPE